MSRHTVPPIDQMLTTSEVMALLRVGRVPLCAWVRDGKIPAVKLPSGAYRFSTQAIQRWMAERSTA